MSAIYFEEKGPALLKSIGMKKVEFARRMGIRRQNVNQLFRTKNLFTLHRAAEVLGVPFEMLIAQISEPELEAVPFLPPMEDDIPVAFSPFGSVYESFRGRPREAFWFLIDRQEGDLRGVFSRSETGDIDLVWGDEDCGVRHILVKHINDRDFSTVSEMIEAITDIVCHGAIAMSSPDKAVLQKDGFVAAIRKNYRMNGKKPEAKNWILTAYSKESSHTTQAPPGMN